MMESNCAFFYFLLLVSQKTYFHSVWASMSNNTFHCNDAASYSFDDYIRDEYFCDGTKDCFNGADELLGCESEKIFGCGKGMFDCDGGKCKDISVRCNTIKDCQDETDELNCGDEVNVRNCTSAANFLCKDGLRCLSLEYTCDGNCNCFDCSDENSNCSKTDYELLEQCSNSYFATANGPRCFCAPNDTSFSNQCTSIRSCDKRHFSDQYDEVCDHHCLKLKSKKQCTCYKGYRSMDIDEFSSFGSQCRITADFVILYANEAEIKSLNNTSFKTSTILHENVNYTLLAAANNYIYYATLSRDGKENIFKMSLNQGKPEKIIEIDSTITSIAVDYITNNIYFTNNGSLSACANDGQICTRLKCCNVKSVRLAPKFGWMFYIVEKKTNDTFKNELLFRSNMDGSEEVIHTNILRQGEVSIEIDESINTIYTFQKLEIGFYSFCKISLDSSKNNSFLGCHDFVYGTVAHFSCYNDEIFIIFTEAPNAIYYLKHVKGITLLYVNDTSTSIIKNLHVYNPAIEQQTNINPCNSSCSGLCLLRADKQPWPWNISHTCYYNNLNLIDNNRWYRRDSAQVASCAALWIIVISIPVVLILAGTGYCIFRKLKKTYGYYSISRRSSRGDIDLIMVPKSPERCDL